MLAAVDPAERDGNVTTMERGNGLQPSVFMRKLSGPDEHDGLGRHDDGTAKTRAGR